MGIPYGRQSIDDDDIAAVVDVLHGDWLTIGPRVAEFESGIAHAFHTRSGACSRPDAASTSGSSEWSSPRSHRGSL